MEIIWILVYILTNLFYEPSTRTSSSFYSAMVRQGGSVIPINNVKFSSAIKGESLEDTIITMGTMSDCIVLRHPEIGSVDKAAKVSSVPIINAGDGEGEHPTQTLLDGFTIYYNHKKNIDNLRITMVGDLNQTTDVTNGIATAEIILRSQGDFVFTHSASLWQTSSSTISTIQTIVIVVRP